MDIVNYAGFEYMLVERIVKVFDSDNSFDMNALRRNVAVLHNFMRFKTGLAFQHLWCVNVNIFVCQDVLHHNTPMCQYSIATLKHTRLFVFSVFWFLYVDNVQL